MKFSVIYSFDIQNGNSVKKFHPPNLKAWQLTEGDEGYEHGHLGGEWEKGKHRKYLRILSFKKFMEFLLSVEFKYKGGNGCAVGALGFGTPETGMELVPSIVFSIDDAGVIGTAYVTPIVDDDDVLMMGLDTNKERSLGRKQFEIICDRVEKCFNSR